jgi:hypothetical protein
MQHAEDRIIYFLAYFSALSITVLINYVEFTVCTKQIKLCTVCISQHFQ